jgi:hypothetical protein
MPEIEQLTTTPVDHASSSEHSNPSHTEERSRFNKKGMLAVSLVGTALASVAATAANGNIEGAYKAAEATLTGHGHGGINLDPGIGHLVVGGQGIPYPKFEIGLTNTQEHSHLVEHTTQAPPKFDVIHPEDELSMPWAHLFSQDPEARDVKHAREDIKELLEVVKRREAQGYKVDSVDVQGFASDEVDQPGAGLNQVNPPNQTLADTRARAATEAVIAPVLRAEGYKLPIHILKGREIQDQAANTRIIHDARLHDMGLDAWIKEFNRHQGNFSPRELHNLERLSDERYVKVVLKMTRETPVAIHTTDLVTERDKSGGSVILIPLLIPLWRRRPKVAPKPKVVEEEPIGAPMIERVPYIPPRGKRQHARVLHPKMQRTTTLARIHKQPLPHNFHGANRKAHQVGQGRPHPMARAGRS